MKRMGPGSAVCAVLFALAVGGCGEDDGGAGAAGDAAAAGQGAAGAGGSATAGTDAAPSGGSGVLPGGGSGGADPTSAGGSSAPAASCTGKAGAPGTNNRSVMNGTLDRTFVVHIPADLDPNTAAPVVFVHHGFTMTGQIMLDLTGLADIADREGFIAVFPDGAGATPWNVGTGICGLGAFVAGVEDDFAFVEKMVADIEADQCVDHDRIMVTGFSMGGYFTNHIGCQQPLKLRAIAAHSGGTYPGDCPGGPIPVMILHGTGDALISPSCGTGARDLWVQRNGCSTEFESRDVVGGHCEWHKDCPPGGQVVACLFDGMAHAWAGAPQGLYGSGPAYESASELIWDFFKQQL